MSKRNVALSLVFLFSVAILGCNTVLDHITPTPISPIVTEYVGESVPEWLGFTTLYHARQLELKGNIKHRTIQIMAARLAQDDELHHADALAYVKAAISEAQAFQDIVVGSESSPISIMGILAGAAPALMAGMAIKRKGDYSPTEVKQLAKDVEARTIEKERNKHER